MLLFQTLLLCRGSLFALCIVFHLSFLFILFDHNIGGSRIFMGGVQHISPDISLVGENGVEKNIVLGKKWEWGIRPFIAIPTPHWPSLSPLRVPTCLQYFMVMIVWPFIVFIVAYNIIIQSGCCQYWGSNIDNWWKSVINIQDWICLEKTVWICKQNYSEEILNNLSLFFEGSFYLFKADLGHIDPYVQC